METIQTDVQVGSHPQASSKHGSMLQSSTEPTMVTIHHETIVKDCEPN